MLLAILLLGEWVYGLIFRAEGFASGAAILPRLGILLAVSVINYLWLAMLIGLDRQWIAALGLAGILAVKVTLGLQWIPIRGVGGMVDAALWAELPASLLVGFTACRLYLRRKPS
jgi:O-antigen/teichoic acid export membrane protein